MSSDPQPPDLTARIAEGVRQRRGNAELTSRHRQHRTAGAAGGGWHRIARLAVVLLITVVSVSLLRVFVIASFYIPSESMEPTLHGCSGCQPDRVLVDKLSYRFGHVARGDVVVFTRPPSLPVPDEDLIKRVIGLPGETVSGHDGSVFIDNRRLIETYVNPICKGTADFLPVRVPPDRYFVMGDNRCNSSDSRYFGTIARSSLIGRAFAVVWPVKHLRGL